MARRAAAAARPIIIRQPVARRTVRRARRRASAGLKVAGESPVTIVLGGVALGFIDGEFEKRDWPTFPVIGRAGTIGLIAYLLRKKHAIFRQVAVAGLTVAGYQFARTGEVAGDDNVLGHAAAGAAVYDDDDDE